jgi:hypothetical protein
MSASFDSSMISFNAFADAYPCRRPRKLFGKNCLNRFKDSSGIDGGFKDSFGSDGGLVAMVASKIALVS